MSAMQVCYERLTGGSKVFQCDQGHFVCSSCCSKVEVRNIPYRPWRFYILELNC